MTSINLSVCGGLSATALISYLLLVNAQPHVEYVQKGCLVARDDTLLDGILSGRKARALRVFVNCVISRTQSLCKMHLLTVCLADGLMRAELVASCQCRLLTQRSERTVRDGEMLSWDGGRQAALGNKTKQGCTIVSLARIWCWLISTGFCHCR